MSVEVKQIRIQILGKLRALQIRKSEQLSFEKIVITIGSMAHGLGYEEEVIHKICSDMEEEDLITWTSRKKGGDPWQSQRSFDITGQGQQFLSEQQEVQGKRGASEDGVVGYPGAYDSAYEPGMSDSKITTGHTRSIKQSNVDVVSNSVRISCQTLLLSVDEFSKNISRSNSLAARNPEIYEFLVDLKEQVEQLLKLLPEEKESATNTTVEKISDWYTYTGIQLHHNVKSHFTPEYVGDNAGPLIIVGLFSSIGAAISGALGLQPLTGAGVAGMAGVSYVGKGKDLVNELD